MEVGLWERKVSPSPSLDREKERAADVPFSCSTQPNWHLASQKKFGLNACLPGPLGSMEYHS
jgi:hypothetical protein